MTRALQFTSLLLTALTLSLTFSHLLEMPRKLKYGPELYMAVQHTLYLYFAWVGAFAEVGAACALLWLLFLVGKQSSAYPLTLIAFVSVTLGLALWFLLVSPANHQMAAWSVLPLPANWTVVRRQWEVGHAISAVLDLLGFACLAASVTISRSTNGTQ